MMNNYLSEKIRRDDERVERAQKDKIYKKGMMIIDPFLCKEWGDCVEENDVKELRIACRIMKMLYKSYLNLDKAVKFYNRKVKPGVDAEVVLGVVGYFSDIGSYFEDKVYESVVKK